MDPGGRFCWEEGGGCLRCSLRVYTYFILLHRHVIFKYIYYIYYIYYILTAMSISGLVVPAVDPPLPGPSMVDSLPPSNTK